MRLKNVRNEFGTYWMSLCRMWPTGKKLKLQTPKFCVLNNVELGRSSKIRQIQESLENVYCRVFFFKAKINGFKMKAHFICGSRKVVV